MSCRRGRKIVSPDLVSDINTVFLVGSGAIENAWPPVCAAIDEVSPHSGVGNDPDAANFWFSQFVQRRRLLATINKMTDEQLSAQMGSNDPQRTASVRRLTKEKMDDLRDDDARLKSTIARNLKNDSVTLRMDFRRAASAFKGSAAFVTTNWDLAIERALKEVGIDPKVVVHLHGHVDEPKWMLLPSELPEEPYRSPAEVAQMAKYQRRWAFFNAAKRIVVYGLSLSPLDASVAHALGMGLDEPKSGSAGEIIVMNCGKEETARVAKRVRMTCLPKWPWKVIEDDRCA